MDAVGAWDWNGLCWVGSIEGFAAQVLFACEKAVDLEPEEAVHRDSRGLARALTGDSAGAVEDFRFFVNQWYGAPEAAQRQAWIAALEAGQNPFDAATLWALRRQ